LLGIFNKFIYKPRLQIRGQYAMAMSFCSCVRLSVRLFVCLWPVKFIKSFATWQHLAANRGLLHRLWYTC